MEEDTEYKKLPVDERCVHKLWKARLDGYEELIKVFRTIDDEKAPEWNKYLGLVKKFVIDSHAMAQERGLEAALLFVENAGNAGRTVNDVVNGLVTKCFSAPKAKIKDLAFQITLMYVEIEKHDATVDELVKGMDAKNPKIVAATINVLTQALREFGSKVISIKPFIKKIPVLLADRDKSVRDETKLLTVEIYRWIGQALKPHIASLVAGLLTELEGEFDKVKNEKAEPTRYLRSQQEKQQALQVAAAASGNGDDGDVDDDDTNQQEELDPMDLLDPVDILSKLPKNFYDLLEAKKWQERKESLEALQKLLENPKLESGEYGDVVKALKKVITKDTNVVLVAMAGKCLAMLAKGLGKKFSPYALACVSGILEKFKEKKANVVSALREAIDAIYPSSTLDAIQEDILEALSNKNPSIKAETASFLARAFARTQPAAMNKKLIKSYSTALLKTLNESDPTVRDCSADALGTMLKLLGEKAVAPFLVDVDALKMVKIKESSEKAEILVKTVAPKKERPTTAPAKAAPAPKAGSTEPKPVARPSTVVRKPAAGAKKSASSATVSKAASSSAKAALPTEREMSPEEVDEKIVDLLPSDVTAGLTDSNWKTRLASAETFLSSVGSIEVQPGNSQALIRTLCKKPGLKDSNFQVLKLKLDSLVAITEKLGITTTAVDGFSVEIVNLLGDAKNSSGAGAVLTAIAESIQFEYVVTKVMTIAFEQKSPKVQAEALNWITNAIREFGMQVNPKNLIEDAKKAVQSINPAVRQAAIQLVALMHLYMGNTLAMFFENEKSALKQQIQTEFDKNAGQKPPKPTRGANKLSASASSNDGGDDDMEVEDQQEIKLSDMLPRVDISPQITEALLAEIADKNWKTRNEGLTKLQTILNDAKLIKPTIGDLPLALSHRLVDSNAKIGQTSMTICQQLAEAMGPSCKQHVRVLFPGFLNGLSDSKAIMRAVALACINAWGDQCGYKEFFEGEMIAEALKSGSPSLRTELWGWLNKKLPTMPPKSIPKDEILACLPYLYANICDRNVDVRKNANEAVLGCMLHVGYEPMVKAMETQKPASKKTILEALDKARPGLPVKPLPKGKLQAPIEDSKPTKTVQGKGQRAAGPAKAAPASRKKEEDVDTSPLLSTNNLKNQRMLDEQKLKVLKWTFTTPREEFTDLLRDQMATAGVNKNLIANMFHDDFRYHLKVIEALLDDLTSNVRPLICNLDLVLKWISLRFYDTNPSVLLKGLDYLIVVMQMLISNEYELTEVEGSSFLPHLLVKLGDPKDAVRHGVRSLFRQICLTYPFTKVFSCIMDGLKSKNARQRTECLDELGYLIETYGMSACQPSAQIALKEIARHIADRDNSVRSAALNCVVQAYFIVDEKVYKLIGQLSEKDMSMLDERIKRAKKTRKVPALVPVALPSKQEMHPVVEEEMVEDDYHEAEPVEVTVQEEAEYTPPKPKSSGPFKLDQGYIEEIEQGWVRSDKWEKFHPLQINTDFLHSPIRSAEVNGVSYPADRLQRLVADAPTHLLSSPVAGQHNMQAYSANQPSSAASVSPQSPTTAVQNLPDILPKLDPNLMRILRSVGSTDSITARAGLNELNDILESAEKQAALRDYEEIYIENVCLQLRNLSQIPFSEACAIYQPLLSSIYSFYASRNLGKNVGTEPLKKFMSIIIGLLVDQKLPNNEENEYTKVINGICLRVFDRSNFTNIICALIRLLKETCSGAGLPKFTDLLMKCIWRNMKSLPEKSNELDYDAVLLETHEFMVTLPSTYWHQRHSDTPYRTVKTLIHHLAQIKGNQIMQHLAKIPTHSELYSYLLKVLKNLQKDSNTPGSKTASRRGTAQNHEAVSAIFKLISDKETGKEGIQKLYEYKQKNPDIDLEHYLQGSNPIFRKFIDDGLAELEKAANDNNVADNKVLSENRYGMSKTFGKDPEYWMERLNALKKNTQEAEQHTDRASVENLNVNLLAQRNLFATKEASENLSSNRLEQMKQRLAQMRPQK